jgi:hypothetical protein
VLDLVFVAGDRKRVRDDPHAFEPRANTEEGACCARESLSGKGEI